MHCWKKKGLPSAMISRMLPRIGQERGPAAGGAWLTCNNPGSHECVRVRWGHCRRRSFIAKEIQWGILTPAVGTRPRHEASARQLRGCSPTPYPDCNPPCVYRTWYVPQAPSLPQVQSNHHQYTLRMAWRLTTWKREGFRAGACVFACVGRGYVGLTRAANRITRRRFPALFQRHCPVLAKQ